MDTNNHTYPAAVITFWWPITIFKVEWRDNEGSMTGSFFCFRGDPIYPTPRKQAKKTNLPKHSQNPSSVIRELQKVYGYGQPYLPCSCRYLYIAYHHLQGQMKGHWRVNDCVIFWFRGDPRYLTPRKQAKNTNVPKHSQNPSGVIREPERVGQWSNIEQRNFWRSWNSRGSKEETYPVALLACWLCMFVFPIRDLNNIRPSW